MDNNREAYIEYLCNQPQKVGPKFYDADYLTGEDDPIEPDYKTACCHHENSSGKRKYVLHFEKLDDDCTGKMDQDRIRCQNFWEFVDTQPKLKAFIKEGKFWHESRPQKLNIGCCIFDDKGTDTCQNKTVRRVRENRALLREKFEKRSTKRKELQMKSKQRLIKSKPPPPTVNLQAPLFSDMVRSDLKAEFASMNQYDDEIKTRMLEKLKKIKH